jgi:hypothetical protein
MLEVSSKTHYLQQKKGRKGGTRNREVTGESILSLCLIMYHAMKVQVQFFGTRFKQADSVPPSPLYGRELIPVVGS